MKKFVGLINRDAGFEEFNGEIGATDYKCNNLNYSIAYEGEIYNSDEIRAELVEKGYSFETYFEEEVILKAYIEWQEECLNRFEGIFTIAIWESEKHTLFFARDQIGAKALYYSKFGKSIIFSDELKYILAHPNVKSEVTYEGICEVILLGPSKRPESAVFRNITALPPGCFGTWQGEEVKVKKYWDFKMHEHRDDFKTTVEKVREMVIESIIKQANSDEDICVLLSGGLDSSIVATITSDIVRQFGKKLTTISVDYEGNDTHFVSNNFQPNSDTIWINKMKDFLNTEHITVKLNNESLLNNLDTAMIARDLPGMADIDSSLLLFCREIGKHSQIGLGGECADEIFGGYPWFHREELMNTGFFPWISSLDDRISLLNDEVRYNADAKKFATDIYNNEIDKVPELAGDSEEDKKIREIGMLTYKWFLPNLLTRQDKMSKYAGITLRAPFCNYKLMEFVFNIPWEMRAYNGREKGLLRYAFKDLLPNDVVERKKSPYPKTYNPIYTELVLMEMEHIMENPTSPIHEIVNREKVECIMKETVDLTARPWYGQLMRGPQVLAFLIQVNMWMKKYNVNIV